VEFSRRDACFKQDLNIEVGFIRVFEILVKVEMLQEEWNTPEKGLFKTRFRNLCYYLQIFGILFGIG
jgi:hypothetical protein